MMRVLGLLAVAVLCTVSVASADDVYIGGRLVGEFEQNPTQGGDTRDACPVLGSCDLTGYSLGGLTWDGSHLWVSYFFSTPVWIFRVDPQNCTIVHQIPGPTDNGIGGLAWDGSALWCLPEQDGIIYRLDPTDGTILHQIPAPSFGQGDPNGAGLAWDGQYLWHADYGSDNLYKLDPSDGSILTTYGLPTSGPSGVGYCSGVVVVGSANTDRIYQIDAGSGAEISSCTVAAGTWPYGQAVGGGGDWSAGAFTEAIDLLDLQLGPSAVETNTWGTIKALYR